MGLQMLSLVLFVSKPLEKKEENAKLSCLRACSLRIFIYYTIIAYKIMDLFNYLKTLVSFKTVKGNTTEFDKLYEYVLSVLPPNMKSEFFISNGEKSLYAYYGKRNSPDILLNAHVDIVPASDGMFTIKKKAKTYIGRGVIDMKYATASFIEVLQNPSLKDKNIALLLTSDEEIGGKNGAGFFIQQNIKPKFVFTPDGGKDFSIEEASKGVVVVCVKVKGVSAHSAYKWKGKSATEELVDVLKLIKDQLNQDCSDSCDHWHQTYNIGKIQGGGATNQVADYAEAFLDFRYAKSAELTKYKKILSNVKKNRPGVSIEYIMQEPVFSAHKSKYVDLWIDVCKDHIKRPLIRSKSHGASDARYFSSKGMPVLVTRPDGGDLHTESEWIDIKSFELFTKILKDFLSRM